MFGSAAPETRDKAMDMFISMWTQIAEKYIKYGDRLIFEGANEELGNRFNDINLCPDGNTLSEDECYEMLTTVTQVFVDTVRSSGGNNEQRFLLIPGYNTDIEYTCDSRYKMPEDQAENKLLISVHYYTPWGYCGNSSLNSWGTVKNYEEQNRLLKMMTEFTEKGYGVVIGEYAVAFNEDGTVKNNLCDFLNNFLNNCDLYGYCPMLWDCNGLYSKENLIILDEDVAALFAGRSYEAQASMTEEEVQNRAQAAMSLAYEEAESGTLDTDTAIAWIMFNSSDWAMMYSVGDSYDPDAKTEGIAATDVEITGAGTYTVGLDFTGTSTGYTNGTAFSALAIGNGEILYPGYVVTITEILINGKPYVIQGKPFTSSDDGKCTRVNLYNTWISNVPEGARITEGELSEATAMILNNNMLSQLETLRITFYYDIPN